MQSWVKSVSIAFGATLMLTATAGAAAADAAAAPALARDKMSVAQVRDCMAQNFAKRGALRDLGVQVTDREGKTSALKMKLFWKPAKDGAARMNLRVLEPVELKGSSYLMLEAMPAEQIYVYLPATQQVQQISGQMSSQPLWGTDFSYGEIKQVHGVLETGTTTRKADAKIGKYTAFVLEAQTKPEATGYKKIVSYADQQSCALLKTEFYAKVRAVPALGIRTRLRAGIASRLTSANTMPVATQYWTGPGRARAIGTGQALRGSSR